MSRLLDHAYTAYADGSPAEALYLVTELFEAVRRTPVVPIFPAGIRRADELLMKLGRELWTTINQPVSPEPLKGDLILATRTYMTGGHTPLIKDLSRALPERPLALWLTSYQVKVDELHEDGALQRTGLADLTRSFKEENPWLLTKSMIKALAEVRPARLFLFHHPDDCVAVTVAAAAAAMGSTICLMHHADHIPSCGLYLENIQIYDFTPRSCAFSREILGLQTAWLPLTCPDPQIPQHEFMSEGHLVTALSGSRGKVNRMRDPEYPELVTSILERTGGRHVQIGPVDKNIRKKTLQSLKRKGISTEKLHWIDSAPTLVDALAANNVDLLINTYPLGGARTAVETMAAGRAMVWHSPSSDLDLFNGQMRYSGAPIWRNLQELMGILEKADRSWLKKQGASSRLWYETHHHPDKWQHALADYEVALKKELPGEFDRELIINSFLEMALETNRHTKPRKRLKRCLSFRPFR